MDILAGLLLDQWVESWDSRYQSQFACFFCKSLSGSILSAA